MKRSYIGLAFGALVAVGAALSLPSGGHSQKLTGLTIEPQTFTFLAPAGSEQYTAIATYIHPPSTQNVTSQAVWKVDDNVVEINAGLVTPSPSLGCGGGTISATLPEGTGGSTNVVTAYATVTVDNPVVVNCPGYGTESELSVQVTGPGTVISTTGSISCPPACTTPEEVGASVGLTAEPTAGYVVTWSSACTSSSGNSCSV